MHKATGALLLGMAALWAAPAWPGTQTFTFEEDLNGYQGFSDTSIFDENTDYAGGGTDGIFSGTTNRNDVRRALIRADLSSIPAGSQITSVTLELTVVQAPNATAVDYGLYRLTTDWGEGSVIGGPLSGGGGGNPAESGDATWSSNFFGTSQWTTAGGDFVQTASGTATAGTIDTTTTWSGQGLIDDVQAWVDDPQSNFGWIVIASNEGQTTKAIRKWGSREASSSRPRLTIVADVPSTTPATDINGDSVVNAVDVQLVINAALDLSIGGLDADINGDQTVNAVDVQLVINAALGL